MFRIMIAALAAGMFAATACANDTTAQFDNNGLVFLKTDSIEMRSEELFISEARVRVRYRFFNKSDQDVITRVAFPLPDMVWLYAVKSISVPADFSVRVDGQPVPVALEQKAMVGGVDRTALLVRLGLPIDPSADELREILAALPQEKWPELVEAGLAKIETYTIAKEHKELSGDWTMTSTYHWQQTFPARREIVVEHDYQPSVGGQVGIGASGEYFQSGKIEWPPEDMQRYCIDATFLAAANRVAGTGKKPEDHYSEQYLDYVLKTGANWAGPIGSFRLVIDKGAPDNLVSFCGDGVKKISPTAFEIRKTNFLPQDDLHVLLITKYRPDDAEAKKRVLRGSSVPNSRADPAPQPGEKPTPDKAR